MTRIVGRMCQETWWSDESGHLNFSGKTSRHDNLPEQAEKLTLTRLWGLGGILGCVVHLF